MKVHIVGAGPTGLTVAWQLSKIPCAEIHVYESKSGPGGSWWEPSEDSRDLHACRALFRSGSPNIHRLFKEMGLKWSDFFGKPEYENYFKYLSPGDYFVLGALYLKVLVSPDVYKRKTLKECLTGLSESGKKLMSSTTYLVDGVGWDVMTAYEMMTVFDTVGLLPRDTQIRSGRYMANKMASAVQSQGVMFHYNTKLESVTYGADGDSYEALFDDGTILSDDLLVLCVDAGPARKLVGDNWGPKAELQLATGQYGAVTFLLEYPEPVTVPDEIESVVSTPYNIIASKLSPSTVVVVLTNYEKIKTVGPPRLYADCIQQLGLPPPAKIVPCWGSHWDGSKWVHGQTSGVVSVHGPVPFFGKSSRVALCGMMSERTTPYSAMEAAVEVGTKFASRLVGTEPPLKVLPVSVILCVLLVLLVAWFLLK